ncbi:unnamed protein product [Cyprideis torosa]|uniref:Uncharacterized protein n=1 Tax=Cyprideis torosa TaxID=163714 RepID=A0A7R8WB69_9CRUS|nr:unnamed protein product [Cyprideis torosa]CAG0887075.1 unnamed protein product [Cyprideis torosa]
MASEDSVKRSQKTRRKKRAQRMLEERQLKEQLNTKIEPEDSADEVLGPRPRRPERRKKVRTKEAIFEQDIVDGFAILSFTSMDDLQEVLAESIDANRSDLDVSVQAFSRAEVLLEYSCRSLIELAECSSYIDKHQRLPDPFLPLGIKRARKRKNRVNAIWRDAADPRPPTQGPLGPSAPPGPSSSSALTPSPSGSKKQPIYTDSSKTLNGPTKSSNPYRFSDVSEDSNSHHGNSDQGYQVSVDHDMACLSESPIPPSLP